jgi:hypothetical protein
MQQRLQEIYLIPSGTQIVIFRWWRLAALVMTETALLPAALSAVGSGHCSQTGLAPKKDKRLGIS